MQLARLWQHFQREFLLRRLPHGLLGPAYLWPGGDMRIRLHRSIWWQNGKRLPRVLWLCAELLLWLRWVSWGAWQTSCRSVKHNCTHYAEQTGLSKWQQLFRVLCLALGWSIPPHELYRYRLVHRPERLLDYIYDHEIGAFHQWRNPQPEAARKDNACIQDKIALAERLQALGVPVVHTPQWVARHKPQPIAPLLTELGDCFCKTRSGNQGRGAFAARYEQGSLRGQTFEGLPLPNLAAIEEAWQKLLILDDALVQPLLNNHPALAPMSLTQEAITVRYISQQSRNSTIGCYSATLEVPAGKTERGQTRYVILPIDAKQALLQPFPDCLAQTPEQRQLIDNVWVLAPADHQVPFWSELVAASHLAHEQFPAIYAIAWDWVITPDGPILLEGNVGWGVSTPQILLGGLLVDPRIVTNHK